MDYFQKKKIEKKKTIKKPEKYSKKTVKNTVKKLKNTVFAKHENSKN